MALEDILTKLPLPAAFTLISGFLIFLIKREQFGEKPDKYIVLRETIFWGFWIEFAFILLVIIKEANSSIFLISSIFSLAFAIGLLALKPILKNITKKSTQLKIPIKKTCIMVPITLLSIIIALLGNCLITLLTLCINGFFLWYNSLIQFGLKLLLLIPFMFIYQKIVYDIYPEVKKSNPNIPMYVLLFIFIIAIIIAFFTDIYK